jgi:hypothetical protein
MRGDMECLLIVDREVAVQNPVTQRLRPSHGNTTTVDKIAVTVALLHPPFSSWYPASSISP